MNKALSIFNQLRPVSVGFDNLFNHFERIFDQADQPWSIPNYPPYNIVKTGSATYDIELALAGYGKEDISVEFADGLLNVRSAKPEYINTSKEPNYKPKTSEAKKAQHIGIAKRFFSKVFTIADDVEIKGAELKDGLLKISLEKIIPEGKKAKIIEIK